MSQLHRGFLLVAVVLGAWGCGPRTHSSHNTVYMPDMVYSPAFKAQKEGAMRMPVQGTVPRDFEQYAYTKNPDGAGRELVNPIRPTAAALTRGQALYTSYCGVCHGPQGVGDGTVVPKFPRPPSLHNDKVRGWTDGRIYHVITRGQNLMPSYASQIAPGDRWLIVHYIRALQRSQRPTPADLKAAAR